MKITKKSILMLVALLGVAAAVAVYMAVYQPNIDEVDSLEAENKLLTTQLNQLKEWERQVSKFQEETENNKTEVNKILNKFPAGNRAEDIVMYSTQIDRNTKYTYISNIQFDEAEAVFSTAPSTVLLTEDQEPGERVYRLWRNKVIYGMNTDYKGLKQLITKIAEDKDAKSIQNLSFSFDEAEGILMGTVEVDFYFLEGTDKEYKPLDIPSLKMGIKNLFGTIQ